jgi:hypothetical protein
MNLKPCLFSLSHAKFCTFRRISKKSYIGRRRNEGTIRIRNKKNIAFVIPLIRSLFSSRSSSGLSLDSCSFYAWLILRSRDNINSVAWVRKRNIPSDRRLSAKSVPTFADRGCHVVSMTDPYGRLFGSLDRSRYFFFQNVPDLYSRGWVDPLPDPLLLRKSSSAGNRTRTSGSVARNSDH